jgi:hypothetical protein
MKKLLILTGPQGSGNHIFARIFSMHKDVYGWKDLQKTYYLKHGREPFAQYFAFPEILTKEFFDSSPYNYFVANISIPYGFHGIMRYPKILEVARLAKEFGVDVQIAIITRDPDILTAQQQRVRRELTVIPARKYIDEVLMPSEFPINFISMESFFNYKLAYLKNVSKILDFPIELDESSLIYLDENPNKKYITPVKEYWLDKFGGYNPDITDIDGIGALYNAGDRSKKPGDV